MWLPISFGGRYVSPAERRRQRRQPGPLRVLSIISLIHPAFRGSGSREDNRRCSDPSYTLFSPHSSQ